MPLPTHPRLAPHAVFLRRGNALQVGISPDRSLVVASPPAGLVQLLGLLDGNHSLRSLQRYADQVRGLSGWPHLLHMLAQHGLLADDPGEPPRVQVITAGVWGVQVAESLLRAGITHVWLVLTDPTGDVEHRALRAARRFRSRLFVHTSWSAPESERVFSLIDSGTVETDRALTTALTDRDVPHLLLRQAADGVVMGPLVVPGASPCVGCLDLQSRHLDSQWPDVLLQLTRVRVPVPEPALQWAAATAVTEILAYSYERRSALLGRTATMTAPSWSPQWRRWRRHPECRCHHNELLWANPESAGMQVS